MTPSLFALPQYKVVCLNDAPAKARMAGDSPERIHEAWQNNIPMAPWFDPTKECAVVFFLNTRRKITGFEMATQGTLDTLIFSPTIIFRAAIVRAAHAIVLTHNHPSGDPTPSDADIKVTRDLMRAGQLLKIELLDHVIIGDLCDDRTQGYAGLRALGHFYAS